MTIQQWDTFLDGVFPLDRNRLTREWFHSGKAVYNVVGPDADKFAGTLELGYQVGFPGHWAWASTSATPPPTSCSTTPTFPHGFQPAGSVITPNLFPGVSISSDLGNGPGIQEVATFSVDVEGPNGSVAVANAHGTVTGAAGGVLLRPSPDSSPKLETASPLYGEPWNMN